MNSSAKKFRAERSQINLPGTARTRSGIEYCPRDSHWLFRDSFIQISLNFNLLPEICVPLEYGLKATLIWYFENRSPKTAQGLFNVFIWFVRHVAAGREGVIEQICPEDILIVKMRSNKAEHSLARLRSFLIRWEKLGVQGVNENVAFILKNLTLRQNPVGVAVETMDSKKGPFTDFEFEAIQFSLNKSYAQGDIDGESLLLCYLLMSLGVRPVQLALLKCGDLIVPSLPDGDYILKVPRVKDRSHHVRNDFKLRKLTRQIGEPLAAHIEKLRIEFASLFKITDDIPIFPQRMPSEVVSAPGFEFHMLAIQVVQKVILIFDRLKITSDRLDKNIPVSAIRFRRTFATRAAEEGWPLLVIAEMLDHSDTRHVQVYAGLTSRIRAEFSRKIAMEMAPLAMAFVGRIIRNEGEATRPGVASRIVDLRVDRAGATMGSCGSHVPCGFVRPLACYAGCYEFEPWLDGPHEAALDHMFARREKLRTTTDLRIASINDRAILGCAQIILRCRQILEEEENG